MTCNEPTMGNYCGCPLADDGSCPNRGNHRDVVEAQLAELDPPANRMRLSEFIAGCQALLREYGDHDLMHEYGTHASLPQFCDEPDGEDPRLLLTYEEI